MRQPTRSGKPTAHLSNGGTQQSLGAFAEGIVQITPQWSVTFAGREDLWSNFDASSIAHSDARQADLSLPILTAGRTPSIRG